MDEPDGGRIAERDLCCGTDAVERVIGNRERVVDWCGIIHIFVVVRAPCPGDASPCRFFLVSRSHAVAFHAKISLQAFVSDLGCRKTVLVHAADDFHSLFGVCKEGNLLLEVA